MLGHVARLSKLPLNYLQNRGGIWTGRGERNYKVTVVGAEGGIGQPLSLLLKQNPLIEQLALHDVIEAKGVAADLSHICTPAEVSHFRSEELLEALQDAHVVVVAAGLPRKPGMSRDELMAANASVALTVACAVSIACPEALLAFITNPINAIVPMAAEFLKAKGVFDPNRLFGITTLDVVRSKTFIGKFMSIDPDLVDIPVIGGHAGITILPLLSQCYPKFPEAEVEELQRLRQRIQEAGTEVVEAKAGKGSATLSMAYAGAHFVNALLRGLDDEEDVLECAYVASNVAELPFLATPMLLGPNGIKQNLGLPSMNEEEKAAFEEMLPELRDSIQLGIRSAQTAMKDIQQEDNASEQIPTNKRASQSE
ncbi:malate dehydrogenase, mitochondrial [Drosophila grimshawi]|uniref:Malate dehydrogenase n=1 Tax=Drosophila grimshawi TaxID=7222 RepID=B4J9C5_DROGR|nr:malate dehydrogenase, mitochondrial [Drosophila grimshawi]EDW01406.1 GH21421 [Drosophila grimshawi]